MEALPYRMVVQNKERIYVNKDHKGQVPTKSKRVKYSTRPSPPYPAKEFLPGDKRMGNDGCMWEVFMNARGVKRWRICNSSQS